MGKTLKVNQPPFFERFISMRWNLRYRCSKISFDSSYHLIDGFRVASLVHWLICTALSDATSLWNLLLSVHKIWTGHLETQLCMQEWLEGTERFKGEGLATSSFISCIQDKGNKKLLQQTILDLFDHWCHFFSTLGTFCIRFAVITLVSKVRIKACFSKLIPEMHFLLVISKAKHEMQVLPERF